jgi:hypothetical protein
MPPHRRRDGRDKGEARHSPLGTPPGEQITITVIEMGRPGGRPFRSRAHESRSTNEQCDNFSRMMAWIICSSVCGMCFGLWAATGPYPVRPAARDSTKREFSQPTGFRYEWARCQMVAIIGLSFQPGLCRSGSWLKWLLLR